MFILIAKRFASKDVTNTVPVDMVSLKSLTCVYKKYLIYFCMIKLNIKSMFNKMSSKDALIYMKVARQASAACASL